MTRAVATTSFPFKMSTGLNTEIEHAGRVYHVQTQEAERQGRAVETLVYLEGAVLVRVTVSYAELEARGSLTDAHLRRVLELQHYDLIRKIQHGMLDGGDGASSPAAQPPSPKVTPESEAFVRELLEELEL